MIIISLLKVGSNSSVSNPYTWLDGSTVNPSYMNTGSKDSSCVAASTYRCLYLNGQGYLDDCPCTGYRTYMCQF